MSKKHFIDLAEYAAAHNLSDEQLNGLADFCAAQNPRFDRQRWLEYIMAKMHSGVAVGEPR